MSEAKNPQANVALKPNLAGSKDSLERCREIFSEDSWRNHPQTKALEAAWRSYTASNLSPEDYSGTRGLSRRDAIHSLLDNVKAGAFPPPEVLLLITQALQRYLSAAGSISLDEAFFGRPHRKNTSYAAAFGRHQTMSEVDLHLAAARLDNPKKSQTTTIEKLLQEKKGDFDTDPESVLRSWRRWKEASTHWTD